MSKNIIITGSNGFVGFNLIKILRKEKHRLYRLGFKTILNIEKLKKEKIKADFFIHCANANLNNSKNNHVYKSNIKIFNNILKVYGKEDLIFLNISSISMYNGTKKKNITLNTQFSANDEFSKSKIYVEKFLQKKIFFKKSVNLRCPGIIGKKNNSNLIFNYIKDFLNNKSVTVYNPNSKFNNLIHVDSLCNVIKDIIKKKFILKKKNNVFILGAKNKLRIKSLLEYIKKYTRSKSKIIEVKSRRSSFSLNVCKSIFPYMQKLEKIVTKYIENDIAFGSKRSF